MFVMTKMKPQKKNNVREPKLFKHKKLRVEWPQKDALTQVNLDFSNEDAGW